jgi:hypothetical protein
MKIIITEQQLDRIENSESNFDKIFNKYKSEFKGENKEKIDFISNQIKSYITNNKINVKFLNFCNVGFAGVRTKDQVIICLPSPQTTLGDFVYTIFHEIRHEHQIRDLKMGNPLSDYDLEDFERLSNDYWKMEVDADNFAKKMVAKLVIDSKLPIDIAKQEFRLSPFIEQYQTQSNMVKRMLENVVDGIKEIKKSGGEYTDIQDHPMIKGYISKLENFI